MLFSYITNKMLNSIEAKHKTIAWGGVIISGKLGQHHGCNDIDHVN